MKCNRCKGILPLLTWILRRLNWILARLTWILAWLRTDATMRNIMIMQQWSTTILSSIASLFITLYTSTTYQIYINYLSLPPKMLLHISLSASFSLSFHLVVPLLVMIISHRHPSLTVPSPITVSCAILCILSEL